MNKGTMTLDQIKIEGLKVLERHLGPDGMIRFFSNLKWAEEIIRKKGISGSKKKVWKPLRRR